MDGYSCTAKEFYKGDFHSQEANNRRSSASSATQNEQQQQQQEEENKLASLRLQLSLVGETQLTLPQAANLNSSLQLEGQHLSVAPFSNVSNVTNEAQKEAALRLPPGEQLHARQAPLGPAKKITQHLRANDNRKLADKLARGEKGLEISRSSKGNANQVVGQRISGGGAGSGGGQVRGQVKERRRSAPRSMMKDSNEVSAQNAQDKSAKHDELSLRQSAAEFEAQETLRVPTARKERAQLGKQAETSSLTYSTSARRANLTVAGQVMQMSAMQIGKRRGEAFAGLR